MTNRRLIIPLIIIILQTAFPLVSFAQESAQATMQVTVRVVKATSVSVTPNTDFGIDLEEGSGDIGTISFLGLDNQDVMLFNDSAVNLSNSVGKEMQLNVETSQVRQKDKMDVHLSGKEKSVTGKKMGHYFGTMTAKVEFL